MGQESGTIYVVAKDCMQNELLAGYLTATTLRKCICVCDVKTLPFPDLDKGDDKRLILLDCLGLDNPGLYDSIQALAPALSDNILLALMNLAADAGVEKTALDFGVHGFFYEHDTIADLVKGIDAILAGDVWISRRKMFDCLKSDKASLPSAVKKQSILTRREEEILRLLSRGGTNESIAGTLCISSHTVRTHIYNIFKKIDVPNRLQASLWAAKYL